MDNRATRSLRVAHRLRYGVGAARSTGFFKTENSKIGGSRWRWSTRSVVHGQRLGCFAVEGVGKAGTRRAVPALVVGAAALSMPETGHRARRWNTKEKRPRRAVGALGFLHFPVAELLNKGRQSGFNLGQNILIVQNWRVQRVMQFQRINANG